MVLGFTGLWINAGVFLVATATIGVVGPHLSRAADRVGKATGLGQTLAGALLLGASTSLPGLIVSFRTALGGQATLAVANSLGGIAAQTLFIAFADIALRSDTIQHEDTLVQSLMQSAVLISLLAVLLMAMLKPGFGLYGSVHPASLLVVVGVVVGFKTIQQTRKHPSWRARDSERGGSRGDGNGSRGAASTGGSPSESGGGSNGSGGSGPDGDTSEPGSKGADSGSEPSVERLSIRSEDRILSVPIRERVVSLRTRRSSARDDATGSAEPDSGRGSEGSSGSDDRDSGSNRDSSGPDDRSESASGGGGSRPSRGKLFRRYAALVVPIGIAGYLISSAAGTIVARTGLSSVVMGLTLTAIATSLPELVTGISAVRRGSVGLAIGDIVGGNAFDTVMVAIADFAYASGPIYSAVTADVIFVTGVTLLMTGVLIAGFVRRDDRGLANIGAETSVIVATYVTGVGTVLWDAVA